MKTNVRLSRFRSIDFPLNRLQTDNSVLILSPVLKLFTFASTHSLSHLHLRNLSKTELYRILTGVVVIRSFGCMVGITKFHTLLGAESTTPKSSPRGLSIVRYCTADIPGPFTSSTLFLNVENLSPVHCSFPRSFTYFNMLGWNGSKLGSRQAEL